MGKENFLDKCMLYVVGFFTIFLDDNTGLIIVFILFFLIDLFTGILASILRDGINSYSSKKARWSFVKTFMYFGSFLFVSLLGEATGNTTVWENVFNLCVYVAIWIESTSILENFQIIFPSNTYLKYLYYMVSTEWIKKISGLMNFIKEKEDKNLNEKQ